MFQAEYFYKCNAGDIEIPKHGNKVQRIIRSSFGKVYG